ncbi:hypothetical protein P3F83_08050 [Mycobacteroides immunogenum]|uniref:hypothetical protein n=1 Tax=Mycobacteroides immunogenum TaxID=83262 RepID=UPI0025B73D20|nr:hypothetical protein [Mycobacteroides immunogenum]WJR35309.1 hypothetical protein P3F83_08050 [Mycobacteroides immunogenum]
MSNVLSVAAILISILSLIISWSEHKLNKRKPVDDEQLRLRRELRTHLDTIYDAAKDGITIDYQPVLENLVAEKYNYVDALSRILANGIAGPIKIEYQAGVRWNPRSYKSDPLREDIDSLKNEIIGIRYPDAPTKESFSSVNSQRMRIVGKIRVIRDRLNDIDGGKSRE